MTGPIELLFTPGNAAGFIDQLWTRLPAQPGGALVGAVHLVGDRGQIVVRFSASDVQELIVRPGQVLVAGDPVDPATWSVIDGPALPRLNLPF